MCVCMYNNFNIIKVPTFITSNCSSSHLTNTLELGDNGREVLRVAISWASLLALAALIWADDDIINRSP